MLVNEDVISILKWSRQSDEDPLFRVAQKWIMGEQPHRALVLEALQRISEEVHSETYKYHRFEIIKIRSTLLGLLNENKQFDLGLVEDSLSDDTRSRLDVKDYACFTLCFFMCLSLTLFQTW